MNDRDRRRVLWVMLAVCVVLPAKLLLPLLNAPQPRFPDFFGLWSFGRYALAHAPATIYDDRLLSAFQAGLGLTPGAGSYSFLYPPWTLLLFVPLGALPYAVARVAWLVLTFGMYAWALTAWRWQRPLQGLLLLAPSSAYCFIVGQNGFLTAALMLGGMRLLWTRPLTAGMLLAALGCKPQLAILVPFVLLFGRHWRATAGAFLGVAVLSVAATLAFGVDTWDAWLQSMRGQAGALTAGRQPLLHLMPTLTSAVLLAGGTAGAAYIVQAAGALGGVLALWRVRCRRDAEARAVLPLATILATPYAFHYDLTTATGAALAVIAARLSTGQFRPLEFPLLVSCVVLPTILAAHIGAMAAAVPVVFAATLWLMSARFGRTEQNSDAACTVPETRPQRDASG